LLEQDRRPRSSKPEEHYHLVLAKNVKASLDDKFPIDYNDDKFQHLTVPTQPSAPELMILLIVSEGEFAAQLNAEWSSRLHGISSHDDQVFYTITYTEDIYQLGAAGTVSTSLPEIVYTSVQTLTTSTLPTLALSSEGISTVSLCAIVTTVWSSVTYTSVAIATDTTTVISTTTSSSTLGTSVVPPGPATSGQPEVSYVLTSKWPVATDSCNTS